MKIVILSSRFPYPLEKGDKLRLYHQLRILSKTHEVHLISLSDTAISKEDQLHIKSMLASVVIVHITLIAKIQGLLLALFNGLPFQSAICYTPKLKRKVDQLLNDLSPDLIYCQLIRMAPYCYERPEKKVIDLMDAFSESMKKRATIGSNFLMRFIYKIEAKRVSTFEQNCIKVFDKATIISQQDKSILPQELHKKVEVISNGIDTNYFKYEYQFGASYDIVFVGNMGYLPNIEAAQLLVKTIAVSYQKKFNLPLRILIAGARPSNEVLILKSENIDVRSWVPDIREAYLKAKIFVAPIWHGTGQQNKILEALALGLPCITTSRVNHAIGAKVNEQIMIADTIDQFVNAIHALLVNNKKMLMLSNNGRTLVEQKFPWEIQVENLNQVFRKVKQ